MDVGPASKGVTSEADAAEVTLVCMSVCGHEVSPRRYAERLYQDRKLGARRRTLRKSKENCTVLYEVFTTRQACSRFGDSEMCRWDRNAHDIKPTTKTTKVQPLELQEGKATKKKETVLTWSS